MVEHLPAMQETWVLSLSQEDPLEKEMATHSRIIAWKIPGMEEPGSSNPWGCKELDRTEQLTLLLSAFFMVQLSHPYMTTGKTIALIIKTFVDKVMSLLYNMLSRFVIDFFPRSKCLLISWLQSPSAVILEPPQIKSVTVSIVSPSICHEVMGPDAMTLVFFNVEF